MSQVINTNIASLNAQRNLAASQGDANVALQRLSSGLRINSAKDDAAGLAISERFQSQITGLNMAQRNANDGISLAQTAEGAMDEITNNLQRIRELAVQSANATNSISDRQALNQEVQQRIEEINRIASQTSFNGLKVLDGTFSTQTFQVGANTGETIAISGLDSRGSQIGSVMKETSNLSTFVVEAGEASETSINASSLSYGGTDQITVDITIGGEVIDIAGAVYADVEALAGAINTEIGNNSNLEGVGAEVSEDGNSIVFTNANTTELTASISLSDDTGTTVNGTNASVAGGGTGEIFDSTAVTSITNESFDGTVSFEVAGESFSVDLTTANSGGQVTTDAELATAINDALQANSATTGLTASVVSGAIQVANAGASGSGDVTFGSVQFTANDNNSVSSTAPLPSAETITLTDKFAEGESYNFNVDINGTAYEFEGITSLNDIVSQVNAKSNETGIEANLNADNDEIFFSSQFGEPFTIDIQADLDGDGTYDAATETIEPLVATVEDDTQTVNDIDISTREGADIAMISVDYAIDTINGFRAQLGAVQNRFESTIQNLSTTSENLSASNSRIRDADFAAETAELARTQVLQSAGLSVLAQANARPQQVLQLLQG